MKCRSWCIEMNLYLIRFNGRLKEALGGTFNMAEEVRAPTDKEARLKLYDKYEHIYVWSCQRIEELPECP